MAYSVLNTIQIPNRGVERDSVELSILTFRTSILQQDSVDLAMRISSMGQSARGDTYRTK